MKRQSLEMLPFIQMKSKKTLDNILSFIGLGQGYKKGKKRKPKT